MTRKWVLTRRKVLAGIGTIGAAGAGAGFGTTAYFSDEESFDDNSLEAGELDLYVHYDFEADQGQASGNLATPTSGTVQGDVGAANGAEVRYALSDVKPGDSGSLECCFSLVDNPGYLWLTGSLTGDAENSVTEPESDTPWERDGEPDGELATYTRVRLYYTGETSDGGNGDVLITEGTLRGVMADLAAGMPLHGDSNPTAGVVDRPTFDGGSDSSAPTDDTCLRMDWEVPEWIGNEIQSDSVSFDLTFYAEQARHNDGTGGMTVVQAGDDVQAAVNDASSGDTLLLAKGTHEGQVSVSTDDLEIRGEGPTNTTYDVLNGASPSSSNVVGMQIEADGVRVGDLAATGADKAVQFNGSEGARLSGAMISNVVAENNGVNSGRGRALVINYTDGALIREVTATDNGNDGVTLWYVGDSHVETVVANDNDDNGIYVNGDNNVILDSVAKRNADEGVDVNWYDDISSGQQRVTLDNVVAMDNVAEDIELHDNGTDDAVADDSVLIRKTETGGAPVGLRLGQVDPSEVRTAESSFPNGVVDGSGTDVDP